ncbi:uncharacterized protein METZ01_LOCUS517800 [marine metagenome]|uniref:Uncharacterized protein n=1 Tax=marine metagenome TaxID=408172 RepID=A0A383F779_9ZZZZ
MEFLKEFWEFLKVRKKIIDVLKNLDLN